MRVNDEITWFVFQEPNEAAQVQFLGGQAHSIGAALVGARFVEQIVEVTKYMRRAVDKIEIRLSVEATKDRVGQFQYIDILDVGVGDDLFECKFDRLGRS